MKKVLVVAYLFPPIGGIGVQRSLKMVKYLRQFGWEPCVLTVDPVYHATYDPSLMQQVPDGVVIERVPQSDPSVLLRSRGAKGEQNDATASSRENQIFAAGVSQRLKGTVMSAFKTSVKTLKDLVMIPDDQALWYLRARKKAVEMVRRHQIEVIYTTSGPHSDLLVGRYVKRKTGIPWIAEFRDPWTQNMHFNARGLRKQIEEKMEHSVMLEADRVVTVTDSFARNFQKKHPEMTPPVVIPNGFDPEDYQNIRTSGDEGKFTLAYTGILYQKRHPRHFLKAVYELIAEGKIERNQIRLTFAGVFDYPGYTENIDFVKQLGLDDIVGVLGYLPHHEALSLLKGADVQLLIGDTAPESGDYIPGKLFEYMALGKPVFALMMPGESTRIIDEYQLGKWVEPADHEAIKDTLYRMYLNWKESGSALSPAGGKLDLQKFQRDYQAGQLAQIMGNLTKNTIY